ncbi:hypothetical protein QLX08_009079 [Tetragonisca angustula]|uniref:PiggyBac transposable element-derived protein domain-containing protein n=1 Tax=Tetragonisca angustula TaxID=166442 RepID=A0AAW0ZHR7_9HYME
MSSLPTSNIFLPFFAQFVQDVPDSEQSDNGSVSNSDAEPEMQDFEVEMQEDNIPETVYDVVPENEESERNLQRIGTSKDTAMVPRQCSLTTKSEHIQTIDESFHLFIDDEIINNIILHTNKKIKECMPPEKQWKPVDRVEIDAFLGLLLLIGRYRESKESKNDLWKVDNALSRRFYTATMSRDRFVDILRYICFDDPLTREERKADDKLAPLRDVTNIFVKNCKDCYNATETGCVDEHLLTFRGRCSFKVYMPNKPGKYGIKIWTFCDSKTFYCRDLDVYLGKHGNTPEKQQGQRVVKRSTNFWKNDEHNILSATETFKPDTISYHNTAKSGVDVLSKIVTEYTCRQCTHRWPLALFMRFIDIAAYNAFILYQMKCPTWESNSTLKTRRKIFLEELGKKLCEKNIDRRATQFENQEIGLHKNVLRAIEATGRNIVKKPKVAGQKRARCCFCIGSNNKYSTICDNCNRYVCGVHSTQYRQILCNACNNT